MLSQRQYNKIIHDWLVLLTSLPGGNVRPQKNEFGFALVDAMGKPIAFDSMICMFYIGFEDRNIDMYFKDVDTVQSLKNASVTVTFIGEQADQYLNTIQSLAFSSASLTYLRNFKFALDGQPREIINDKEYSEKWFYRRTIIFTLNTVFEFIPNNTPLESDIVEAPIYINYEDPERKYIEYLQNLIDTQGGFGREFRNKHITDFSFLSKLDTKNLTDLNSAFFGNDMETIPYIDTSNVIDTYGMFMNCINLKTIPSIDMSKIGTYTEGPSQADNMFEGCSSLISVPNLNTININSFNGFFDNCSKLETVNGISLYNVVFSNSPFYGCSNLKRLILIDIKTSIQISNGTSYGNLLTNESLINTIQQLWDYSGTINNRTLTIGSVNINKLVNIYVREVFPDLEWIERDPNIIYKKPFEICQSTDEGAILILDYAKTKNWTIK